MDDLENQYCICGHEAYNRLFMQNPDDPSDIIIEYYCSMRCLLDLYS